MNNSSVLLFKFPLVGVAASGLVALYITNSFIQEKDQTEDITFGIFVLVFLWGSFLYFISLAIYRRNPNKFVFSKDVSVAEMSEKDMFFTVKDTDDYGSQTYYTLLLTSSQLIIWKMSAAKFSMLQPFLQQRKYTTTSPEPIAEIPTAHLRKVVKFSYRTVAIEYVDGMNRGKQVKIVAREQTEAILAEFAKFGWERNIEKDSASLHKWELKQNITSMLMMSFAVSLLQVFFIYPNLVILATIPLTVMLAVVIAHLVTRAGTDDLEVVIPK